MSKDFANLALTKHRSLKGKIAIQLKAKLSSKDDLSIYYTPGVAAVSRLIHRQPDQASNYTWLKNNLAVISDGSAVLGLGNIGPVASLPVMEGKALLFKHFADIDAVPIILNVHSASEIVAAVEAIAPSFGAINLEDIAAPICFEVEQRLIKKLEIPVMHDDQHGTAVVVLAGLINAFKVTSKQFDTAGIVIVGAGAAGTAIANLLKSYGAKRVIMVDSKGIIGPKRKDLHSYKKDLLKITNPQGLDGDLNKALLGSDVFIGVSQPNILSVGGLKLMAENPIIFAMSNPDPEINPKLAMSNGAAIMATGRSDLPNQINNALAFPGIFRGALDNNIKIITTDHKIAAAKVIANLVRSPTNDHIIPKISDRRLVPAIAKTIR